MGPLASVILQLALLPGAAIREGLKPEGLVLDAGDPDGCLDEAQRIEQLMRDLGHPGPLEGNHCDWPGITCWKGCRVEKIHCGNCSGHLPEKVELEYLWEVSLTSPMLSGNIKAFSGIQQLNSLELKGTEIYGDLEVFREDNLDRLVLADTKITGDLENLARMWLVELDLSGTAISGDLQSIVGDIDRWFGVSQSKGRLRHLKLGNTNITGQLSTLMHFPILIEADLSFTSVTGWLDSRWKNKCPALPSSHRTRRLRSRTAQTAQFSGAAQTDRDLSARVQHCPDRLRERSSIANCDHELAVKARHCPLRSSAGS